MKTRSLDSFSPGETDMSAYPDEQLVLEALDDSHPAFERLIKQYQYGVLRTIASIISDEQAAQDVAQETFLSAWSNLAKLKEKRKFGRWLNQTAINLSKRWLRDQRKRQEDTASLKDAIPLMQEWKHGRDRLRQKVWDAIDELKEEHREVVVLHYISGYSYKEISQMLSVPFSTVSGRLQKAKDQLRKEFLDMVAQLQLEIDSTVHKFLKERAKQDGVSVEGLIIRLIERYKRDTDSPGITVRKLEDCGWGGWSHTGAPSPDGRYFSFMSRDGNLAVRDLTTGGARDVTNDGNSRKTGPKRFCAASIWSPDSKQIAYLWNNEGYNELRIIGLDGTEPRVLYRSEDPALGIWPWDWSQDGKLILGSARGESDLSAGGDIVLVSVADGSVRILKSPEEHEWLAPKMRLSPDGRYVAYARSLEKNEVPNVFLLATDGSGQEVKLAGHMDARGHCPVWTPDGKGIVFRCTRGPVGNTSLWLTRMANGKQMGEPQLVMEFVGYVQPLGFTREGSLYYGINSALRGHVCIASVNMETGEVESQPTRIRCDGRNWNPAWSPDGKSLAYRSQRYSPKKGPGSTLVIRSMETGEEREIRIDAFLAPVIPHRWSPDGGSILCGNWSNRFLLDVQTGDVAAMKLHPEMTVLCPEWSQDGKTLFYSFRHPDKELEFFSIGAHDLETGREWELYTGGSGWSLLAVSPDGQELAFSDEGYRALKVIPTAGGEAREILSLHNEAGKPHEHVSPVAWTRDGRYLLFVKDKHSSDGSPTELQELWRISTEDGKAQKLLELKSGPRSLSLHPDGQRIAYAEMEPDYRELWVMENLLTTFAADK